ncbi:ABC transporter ATP-binding protein [Bordetella genomosp. 8]|uniref:ABC transporter ATP-binding protein n=1 Tax=Bordetella genomosp. 8 TaxID=1416806 RepID=A0A1W6YP65_9BORD|nr:ATP-binding cassette domain-containing protein [Bordetella genomosp. 8]ARP82882.1 ABC transporter ATP-binding protein [Bordetella genomosp. 8]
MLQIEHLTKHYAPPRTLLRRRPVPFTALDDVSLTIQKGQSFGVVGESGSGKTTLTRCVLGLESLSGGRILFDGQDVAQVKRGGLRDLRARMQIVFQDPYASLNPRMTVGEIIAEPLRIHRDKLRLNARQQTDRVRELLQLVGLNAAYASRFPHEFSGGQRQRIGIARALAAQPEVLILDEPTSALDVSVQAQVLNLLLDLQSRLQLTYLFISHDLGVIRYVCDRVALLYRGKLVEEGPTQQIFDHPRESYTRSLLAAMPGIDPDASPFHGRQGGATEAAGAPRS